MTPSKGSQTRHQVKLHLMDYAEDELSELELHSVAESLPYLESPSVAWLSVTGVQDEQVIEDLGKKLGLHPLVLEDIVTSTQRPKVEEYDDYLVVIVKMAYFSPGSGELTLEQISLLVGSNYVISLQEKTGAILESLRSRIRNSKGKIRKLGSDYLMYAILDTIVDYYFSVLENVGEEIEELEDKLMLSANQALLNQIYRLKQELVYMRKSIWPMREVLSSLQRTDHELVRPGTIVYLRDVYDHTVQVIETLETFRDTASGMLELYLSTVSNKLNEIMKVLTIFSAIFIPLTFLAGVYGMNFKYFPELNWHWAYPVWWGLSLLLIGSMLWFFKRRKWM